jgi:hypothetical protein
MRRVLCAVIVILVPPHLAHVLEHGRRERRHAQGLGRTLRHRCLRCTGTQADKCDSENKKSRSLEDIGVNRNPGLHGDCPRSFKRKFDRSDCSSGSQIMLWELWRASCDRGEMLVNFNICYPAIGGLLISTVRLTS